MWDTSYSGVEEGRSCAKRPRYSERENLGCDTSRPKRHHDCKPRDYLLKNIRGPDVFKNLSYLQTSDSISENSPNRSTSVVLRPQGTKTKSTQNTSHHSKTSKSSVKDFPRQKKTSSVEVSKDRHAVLLPTPSPKIKDHNQSCSKSEDDQKSARHRRRFSSSNKEKSFRKKDMRTDEKRASPSRKSLHNHCKERSSRRRVSTPHKISSKGVQIGYKTLTELITKSPDEILLTLRLPDNGFLQRLNQTSHNNLTVLILIALGNACKSVHRQNLMYLINTVAKNSMFMFCSVQQYLANFQNSKNDELCIQSFEMLLKFLSCYNELFPASACETLSVILPLLKTACQSTELTHPDLFDSSMKKVNELMFQKDNFLKQHSNATISNVSKMEKVQIVQPPENFRTISILPNNDDIWNDHPFLRPNITNGKYSDMEHYLDVQFRLLREDYVRPLRKGIVTYLRLQKDKKALKKCNDVKIYCNVHITKQEFIRGSPVHLASFDIGQFQNVKWEFSKRFLSGSLVCLSHDDFQTSYFASIVFRDVEKLKEGILILAFEELSDDVLNFSPAQTFVMIETDAYFEAYRHNLSALQEIQTDKFPLRNYIVDVSREISNPAYLNKLTKYDMGPLIQPLEGFTNRLNSHEGTVRPVEILNNTQWPTADELHLDQSQYVALKSAITREFAVIQGPPGTGKTYVGLKIVQLLLHNISQWTPPEAPCPILIVCYTNHALDQFLEGILRFTKNIVRVGGRCSSEVLSNYQLAFRKKALQQKREVPHYIFSNLEKKNFKLRQLGRDLKPMQRELETCNKELVDINKLGEYMTISQHESLRESKSLVGATKKRLHRWLNLTFQDLMYNEPFNCIMLPDKSQHFVRRDDNFETPSSNYNEDNNHQYCVNENDHLHAGEFEDMADIDYVQDMRGITGEEYTDLYVVDNWPPPGDVKNNFPSEERLAQEKMECKMLEEYAIKNLKEVIPMTEEEAETPDDVWLMDYHDRWRLYKYWFDLYISTKQGTLRDLQQQIRTEYQECNEMKTEENLNVLRDAKVVGMTTTGAAKYRTMVQNLNPRIVIVEEAAEILESHVITSLAAGTQHLILIGDHKQLRPNPNVYELATKFNLEVSLFERMVKNGIDFQQLSIQHRMHPSIASLLVPHIYQNLKNHESVCKYESIKGVAKNLFFITHNSIENQVFDSKSKVNDYEGNFIAGLCRYFILQGYASSQITVLTTYSGQLFLLRRLIRQNPLLQEVKITVVDNFQGEENDIILISFVRSNEEGNIGFLSIANRVCVALSRAKKGLFAIGNFTLLAEKSELWKNIVASLKEQNAIGTALTLKCQNHPEVVTNVAKGSDFDKVPEGGCQKPCEFRLECGHICVRMCHIYDSEHEEVNCLKKCEKVCKNNHRCSKLCYEECGPCEVLIKQKIPKCKHKIFMPCFQPAISFSCTARCEKELPCSHACQNLCGQSCTSRCTKLVSTKLACGHDRELLCCAVSSKDDFLNLCKSNCGFELQCGHICSGTCGGCYQGRLHKRCMKPCKRILVCGHVCGFKCSESCPPCKKKCQNQCKHSFCPRECGKPCAPCQERCHWSCKHQKCHKKCGALCDRKPCNIPCTKALKCGHKCNGLCGEPCPKLCIVCNPEMKEIFFGSEDSDNARFIELYDCKHVFEIEGITHWMEMANEREGEIQMKACPKCKTVIRKSVRFGNIIKNSLADIEKVKSLIFGDIRANERKLYSLISRIEHYHVSIRSDHILYPLFEMLTRSRTIDSASIIRSENIITMFEDCAPIWEYVSHIKYDFSYKQYISIETFKQIESFSFLTFQFIKQFISEEYRTASNQQLEELSWEIHRLKQIEKYLKFYIPNYLDLQGNKKELCQQIVHCLCKLGPFSSSDEKEFNDMFRKINSAVINVSDAEKKSILTAMNLSKGHWFMCPNGHVYCITECGGAMQEGKCNECNATIGGQRHALRDDNRLARDMDGATRSAYPQANDIGNYEPFF